MISLRNALAVTNTAELPHQPFQQPEPPSQPVVVVTLFRVYDLSESVNIIHHVGLVVGSFQYDMIYRANKGYQIFENFLLIIQNYNVKLSPKSLR